MLRKTLLLLLLAGFLCALASPAGATTIWEQGFETDTAGWNPYMSTITRAATGPGGATPSEGSWLAVITDTPGAGFTGAYTFFDGPRSVWPGTWSAEIDIYLDTSWAAGSGFDYSVAAWGTNGLHQRDFIFHVAQDTSTGELLVGGSNNSSNQFSNQNLEAVNHYTVGTSGWYTFQHIFYDIGGSLAVDLNLLDSAGTVLFTETRHTAADAIPAEVGGNGYGWFTFIDVGQEGLAVDASKLDIGSAPVPEPGTGMLAFAGLLALTGTLRRKQK